jgi:hypothetical protein
MQTKQYKTLGYSLDFEVPATVEEFNQNAWKADTGEGNPCLSEGINNIIYRGSLAEFRYNFLHGVEEEKDDKGVVTQAAIAGVEELTGVARNTEEVKGKDGKVRMKDGEPVTKFTESEEKYFDRVIAHLIDEKKFASEETARASFEPLAKQIATLVRFDAAAKERSFAGPKKLAQKYKLTAARIIANGTVAKANESYLSKIGKTFEPTGDTTKMFKGTYEVLDSATKKPTGKTAEVEVSDKDAEALGWLLKEYQDWKAAQEQAEMV